jgi:hypothetical protein
MPRTPRSPRLYNLELEDLLKARKPYTELELAEICDRLGDKLEAERWRQSAREDR